MACPAVGVDPYLGVLERTPFEDEDMAESSTIPALRWFAFDTLVELTGNIPRHVPNALLPGVNVDELLKEHGGRLPQRSLNRAWRLGSLSAP